MREREEEEGCEREREIKMLEGLKFQANMIAHNKIKQNMCISPFLILKSESFCCPLSICLKNIDH